MGTAAGGLAAGDLTGEVAVAWQGKELLRVVYAAGDLAHARAALERFYRWSDGTAVAELSRLARTVRAWEAEMLAFHTTGGCSNGSTEAVNLLVKKVKRVGHGFRNVANYRLRLLLHCGARWQTHPDRNLRHRPSRPVNRSKTSTWPPARVRIPLVNAPLKQQSSSSTIRRAGLASISSLT